MLIYTHSEAVRFLYKETGMNPVSVGWFLRAIRTKYGEREYISYGVLNPISYPCDSSEIMKHIYDVNDGNYRRYKLGKTGLKELLAYKTKEQESRVKSIREARPLVESKSNKKKIKDLTREEFEKFICDTDLGKEYSEIIENVLKDETPLAIYFGSKTIQHIFEQEIEVD